jgi:hypothetical protein
MPHLLLDTEISILQGVNRVINVMKIPRNHMTPKRPVWLMQFKYQVDSYLYPDLCIARDCFMILMFRNFQFNAISRGSLRPDLPYKMVLLDVLS